MWLEGGEPCVFRENVWTRGQYGVTASGQRPGAGALAAGCGRGYVWTGNTMIGVTHGEYPPGTNWVRSEGGASLAGLIRRVVQRETAGVVVP
jgi:hypothetical protein